MSFHLPVSIVDSLLDKLGSDDEFRVTFLSDPRAALASLGFAPASDPQIAQGRWFCLAVDELASKEAIRQSHEEIRRQLVSQDGVFFAFSLGVRYSDQKAVA